MRVLAGRLVLGSSILLAACAVCSAADAPVPQLCQIVELASLDVLTVPDGRVEVPVLMNGRVVAMIVDTGSVQTSISSEIADELGIRREPAKRRASFLNNVTLNEEGTIDDFRIGAARAGDGWTVFIDPNRVMPPTAFGFLGPDFFKDDDVEFDFFHGRFNIFRHNRCQGNVVYWTHDPSAALPITVDADNHIVALAQLDGKPVSVIFDTGSENSVMSVDGARSLFGWTADDARVKQTGMKPINNGSPTPLYSFPFGSLTFDGVSVLNPQIMLIPQAHFILGRYHQTDIVLGMSVLRQLRIYVDYKGRMIYLTAAEAH